MVHNYEGDGVLRISLDLLNITEELVNNLSSKGFQGQGGNVADERIQGSLHKGVADAHEVHEPHSEKAQHHRQKLYLFIHFDSV